MNRALPLLLVLGFVIFCLVDCFQTPTERVRTLPKVIWVLVILILPVVGGAVWLLAGRTWGASGSRGDSGGRGGGRGPTAPDDDDDFLRGLN